MKKSNVQTNLVGRRVKCNKSNLESWWLTKNGQQVLQREGFVYLTDKHVACQEAEVVAVWMEAFSDRSSGLTFLVAALDGPFAGQTRSVPPSFVELLPRDNKKEA